MTDTAVTFPDNDALYGLPPLFRTGKLARHALLELNRAKEVQC